jgi:hypothetical protein
MERTNPGNKMWVAGLANVAGVLDLEFGRDKGNRNAGVIGRDVLVREGGGGRLVGIKRRGTNGWKLRNFRDLTILRRRRWWVIWPPLGLQSKNPRQWLMMPMFCRNTMTLGRTDTTGKVDGEGANLKEGQPKAKEKKLGHCGVC